MPCWWIVADVFGLGCSFWSLGDQQILPLGVGMDRGGIHGGGGIAVRLIGGTKFGVLLRVVRVCVCVFCMEKLTFCCWVG